MPHASLQLIPGVDENKTPALNQAAISYSQLIRFIPDRTGLGLVQKYGGWQKFIPVSIGSPIRALWAWEDANAQTWLAYGATASLGIIPNANGSVQNITPQTITSSSVPVNVSTTAGSNIITITQTASNISNYDTVFIETPIAVGGLVLFGLYQCYYVSADTYQILATDVLGNPSPAYFSTSTPNTTTGASGSGTVATLTFSGSYVYPVGSYIQVSGVTPTGYNGYYQVTASSAGSVSYANTTTGSQTVAGTISNTGTVPLYTVVSASPDITVTLPDHGYSVGSTYTDLIPTTVGGITITGDYFVTNVINANNFVITNNNLATSSTSAFMNGGNAYYLYYIGIGPLATSTGYGVGGYGVGGYGTGVPETAQTGTPITATDWTLDNWGSVFISNPLGGGIFTWNPTAQTQVANIIPEAPSNNNGVFVAMPQRQLVAWGSTFNGIIDPLLIRWSDVNDYTVWAGQITNQAGSYRIPKGSRIVQCIQGPQQALIWTDLGLWSMQYIGPDFVYSFNEIGTGCGLIGRKAAASMMGVVYWMGQSQFYMLSGGGVQPIQCPVWDVIFQDLDTSNLDKIRIAVNSRFGEVAWFYPTKGNSGEINAYVKYNVVLNCWDYGVLQRTAWINESVFGPPIGADANGYIYQHETTADADGLPMVSNFQTGYFVIQEGDLQSFIDQVWPDMKWGYFLPPSNGGATYQSPTATVQLTFYVANYPGDTPIAYGPFNLTQETEWISPRFRGRLVSIQISSSDIGSFWRIGNMRYRYQPDGKY